MWQLVGFDQLSSDAFFALISLAFFLAVLTGWVTDAIMRDNGFGVIGNGLLSLVGGFAGLAAWNRFIASPDVQDIILILVFSTGCAIFLLLLLAIARRYV